MQKTVKKLQILKKDKHISTNVKVMLNMKVGPFYHGHGVNNNQQV
jgi:hypothetical protein